MWTVCVIARDEEDRLARCLASGPRDAARVVVVDDRTTDGTARWAERAGARVLVRRLDGFAAQRNAALDAVATPWALFLDADEALSDAARAALADPPDADGLRFPFRTRWLGRTLRAGRIGRDAKVRAVRVGRGRWVGDVHERLVIDGRVAEIAGPVLHDPYRDWTEHLRAIDAYARAGGRRPRWPGERVARTGFHAVDALVLRSGWRDGPDGVAVAIAGAWSVWRKWSR